MRIGHGYDVHRFTDGNEIVIGGVTIAHKYAMQAHSDGDVLIHAICDALLGAAGLWDIGHHFPDTDAAFKDIDSRVLLRRVIEDLASRNWLVGNIDATIVAEKPKMAPHIPQMCQLLAQDMNVSVDAVNIKATTTEKLGFTGKEEGIAAHAVALIKAAE